MTPKIGDCVFGVNVSENRLGELGRIHALIQLTDIDDNLWKIWFSDKPDHFEYFDSTGAWHEPLGCWTQDYWI